MKKNILTLCITLLTIITFAQNTRTEIKKETNKDTKFYKFSSKSGSIIKFIDYKLPKLKFKSSSYANTRIRKLINGEIILYFYQIIYRSKYGTNTTSIAYEDLKEVIKAIKVLKLEINNDENSDADYIENKFITDDDFRIGYHTRTRNGIKGTIKWYIVLERYGTDDIMFINNISEIENLFNEAVLKIESIK